MTKLALQRPIFIFMLMFLVFVMGFRAMTGMRKEENPDVAFGVVSIQAVYPGADPDTINTLVARKIESAVSGVNGLNQVSATSQEGFCVVVCNFEVGTNMDTALNDVRSKVDSVVGELPTAVEKPTVSKTDFGGDAVISFAVSSDKLSSRELRDLLDDKLKDKFGQIDGVSSAFISGGDVREIKIEVKKDALLAYGLGITDVVRTIQNASLNVPSGRIQSGQREITVRVMGEFKKVDEIRQMRLTISDPNRPNAKASVVRLGDVATVSDAVSERRVYSRVNGKDTVLLQVFKIKEGNAVSIADAALKMKETLQKQYSDIGLKFETTRNIAKNIEESIADVNMALYFGIFLVTAIVYLFLHNLRGTIIVGIAIPVCLLATFIGMQAMGFTINNMTMLALSLAIGVLVDDAIVVLENIYRHLRMGESPRDAAINGRNEIGLAALAITMADVVVFLPVGTMGGIVGQFFKPLGLSFVVCVIMSLLVSFTVTPLLAARWYKQGEDMEHPTGRFAVWFERMFDRLVNGYRRRLEWALNHRWVVFVGGFVILIGSFMFIAGGSAPSAGVAFKDIFFKDGEPGLGLRVIFLGIAIYAWQGFANGPYSQRFKMVAFGVMLFSLIIGMKLPAPWGGLVIGIGVGGLTLLMLISKFVTRSKAYGRVIVGAFVSALALGLFAVAGYGYHAWKGSDLFAFQFMPVQDNGQISVTVEMPPGTNLATTDKVVQQIEAVAAKIPEAEYVVGSIGSKGGGGFSLSSNGTNLGSVSVNLRDKQAFMDTIQGKSKDENGEPLRKRADTAIASELMRDVGHIPGATINVTAQSGQGFGLPIQIALIGDDRDLLFKTATKIQEAFASGQFKGVHSPVISAKAGKPELQAIPERIKMADNNLSVGELGLAMRALYEGDKQAKFRVFGREYDIRVQMSEDDRNNPDIVSQLPVAFRSGNPVFLSEVATLQSKPSIDKIDRINREEQVTVSADLLPGFAAGSIQQDIDKWIKDKNVLPDGIKQKNLGQADVQQREMGYLLTALGLGFMLVFMLLASLYNNVLYPFIIQLAQPQAMVGAILALVFTDKAMTIVSFIGIITLVGLVGKNAILLVDYANTLRGRGMNRHDALVESGATRLRPILMTTSAVILGSLPVALAIGRGSEFRETLGITIIGGILLSTALTLLVIPCSYTIFDDLYARMRRMENTDATFLERAED